MSKGIVCCIYLVLLWVPSSVLRTVAAETIYITLEKDNALAVVDPDLGELVATIPIGQRPRGIALSHDQSQLYVATSDDHVIQIIDVKTLAPVGVLPSGDDPETFALHTAADILFVSNEDDSLVSVVDVNKQQVIHG
ncbi:MAG: beta-propeller fold lactonase family protein, partial [Methylococcales bacterium]